VSGSLAAHELGAVRVLGGKLIVRAAAKTDSSHSCRPATREGLNVIKLEAGASFAAFALLAHERALPAIALPDGSLDL
jgi:hypothetical protein